MGAGPVIAVVDDHPPILRGVVEALKHAFPDGTCLTAHSVSELDQVWPEPSVVILDLNLRDGSDPAESVARLVARGLPVLLYTQDTRRRAVQRCLRAGAHGIVGKDEEMTVLAQAVRTVLVGEPHLSPHWAAVVEDSEDLPELSPREAEALRLYATGLLLRTVARRMDIQEETVKEYLGRVRKKYARKGRGHQTRAELTLRAVEDGYLSLE